MELESRLAEIDAACRQTALRCLAIHRGISRLAELCITRGGDVVRKW